MSNIIKKKSIHISKSQAMIANILSFQVVLQSKKSNGNETVKKSDIKVVHHISFTTIKTAIKAEMIKNLF